MMIKAIVRNKETGSETTIRNIYDMNHLCDGTLHMIRFSVKGNNKGKRYLRVYIPLDNNEVEITEQSERKIF